MEFSQIINNPSEIKNLDTAQLNSLCEQLRSFLIENISKTGGHLASNLGAVEIIVALHRVFDSSVDRFVFDVGHQCYVHKILTGRMENFPTLRSFGGISGFPKPSESPHDAFIAGHASTSVSAALGMARARTLKGDDYSVVALLGDGSMTGGLSYEALNDAGQSNQPLIVILNDNGMSITKNVGGISKHLARLRLRPQYFHFKDLYHKTLSTIPGGKRLYGHLHNLKRAVKDALLPGSLFESMGFTYLGPADGHDVNKISQLLCLARDMKKPVLIHLHTIKGKGYVFSEKNPCGYHGVDSFDISSGKNNGTPKPNYSGVFGNTIVDLAYRDDRICAVTAAMGIGTGLSDFSQKFPNRYFDVGIAEEHAVTMAAGMAKQGLIPVCAIYSSFIQRSYDMLIQDVCMQDLHVVLAIDRAGIVGEDGETHHGVFDVGFLSQLPNMKIYCPSNFSELQTALRSAVSSDTGPVAVRYPRGGQGAFTRDCMNEAFTVLRQGGDMTLITYGRLINEALKAADMLEAQGLHVQVVKVNVLKPLDLGALFDALSAARRVLIAEECVPGGCLGQTLSAYAAQNGIAFDKLILINTGERFITHGNTSQLLNLCGLDAQGMVRQISEACADA